MKTIKIKRLCLTITCILVLFITACRANVNEPNDNNSSLPNTQNSKTDDEVDSEVPDAQSETMTIDNDEANQSLERKDDTSTETIEPVATKIISIYTINESTQEVESVDALVPDSSDVTPELIVEMVVDSFADRLVTVGINDVTTQDDTVIVNFQSDQPPLANVDKGLEATILDSIAQSLVDNLDEYPKVIFRAEGKSYSTVHFKYGFDEVYLDVNGKKE